MPFRLKAPFKPAGDQPKAIRQLVDGIRKGYRFQTLLGVTGSGKTFTMANVIAEINLPTLVIAPNKTLAAQLYREFRDFFPENAVEYFVSYFDYYQPEAYVPEYDLYIEKDSSVNEELERLRLSATSALLERDDVIVVATVSSLYGIGSPEYFKRMRVSLYVGQSISMDEVMTKLVTLQYERNEYVLQPGVFQVRGDTLRIFPSSWLGRAIGVEFFGDEVDRIFIFDPLTGEIIEEKEAIVVYPARHFVIPQVEMERAIAEIEKELSWWVAELRKMGKEIEARRVETRTRFDIDMMRETGYCKGIENYSRHLYGRKPGERPATIIDYFPEKFLTFIDESHITIGQLHAMYHGDYTRKKNLVEHGFRLPSAYDHRPLKFDEFVDLLDRVIFVSATPGDWELEVSQQVVEQIVRPTGLLDPEVEVRPSAGQIEDLISEIAKRVPSERVLVLTLTKRMAEELADYLSTIDVKYSDGTSGPIKVEYLHSEMDAFERVQVLKKLREGEIHVVVGINLLREGLDLPEVSLVAILDADKEGFLRSRRSLIQMMGRAARNVRGKIIMYADELTDSMKEAIEEVRRRRKIQEEYNRKHGIVPQTVKKEVKEYLVVEEEGKRKKQSLKEEIANYSHDPRELIKILQEKMWKAAADLDFELAAQYRDKIREIEKKLLV